MDRRIHDLVGHRPILVKCVLPAAAARRNFVFDVYQADSSFNMVSIVCVVVFLCARGVPGKV
jgi:hypothetical protein